MTARIARFHIEDRPKLNRYVLDVFWDKESSNISYDLRLALTSGSLGLCYLSFEEPEPCFAKDSTVAWQKIKAWLNTCTMHTVLRIELPE